MMTRPTLILDESKCKQNIKMMSDKAKHHQVEFRPHFKTHQSLEIGRWFKGEDVNKITVSSLDMAAYFSKEWDDITVAFPINILEIDTINTLAKRITLNILIESETIVNLLEDQLTYAVNFFIKINVGNNRAGLEPHNIQAIRSILDITKSSKKLNFIGFLGHAGQTYKCRNHSDILTEHDKCKHILISLKNEFRTQYPNLKLSLGDTPSCSISEDFNGIDEIRPGNFVFYDVTQSIITSCEAHQIAIAMACPIVAIHPNKNEIIVYGGGIHLSKDRIVNENGVTIFGKIVSKTETGWSNPLTGIYVKSLSQEHGVIHVPDEYISDFKIGDYTLILPVHSCMTADLMKHYRTTINKSITMFNPHLQS